MGKPPLSKKEKRHIVWLRKTGHSIPEIAGLTGHSKTTVFRYVEGVCSLPKFAEILRQKQGGSKARAESHWYEARLLAQKLLLSVKERDLLYVLIGIYWGEGTKKELSLINSDSRMLKVFLYGLEILGVEKTDLRVSIRIFEGTSIKPVKKFWLHKLSLDLKTPISVYQIKGGRKVGKHPYGMCRIRVAHSAKYFKLLMSMIDFVADAQGPRSSTDRTVTS